MLINGQTFYLSFFLLFFARIRERRKKELAWLVEISANSTLGECARSGISVLVGFLGSFIHSKGKAPSALISKV